MVFSELYSAYYNAVARLIEKAISGELNAHNISDIISDTAFSESFLYITEAIRNEEWSILTKDFKTPIKHVPDTPLTNLQLAFLKTITLDPRFTLFAQIPKELEDVEPLYTKDDFFVFDEFDDGDPYEDKDYKEHFKLVLEALNNKRMLNVEFTGGKGGFHRGVYIPRKLEFSAKDNRFRLICKGNYEIVTINLARIKKCTLMDCFDDCKMEPFKRKIAMVEIEIIDKRNALERMMTTFANYKKETKKINETTYILTLSYYKEDETEVLIRILSFGPMVKVLSPQSFIDAIKVRIQKQLKLCN